MSSVSKLVSVVIPSYNKAAFLPEAIISVCDQTYSLFEIIVVDDGSTDATSSVMSGFPQARYIRQENQGPSMARNRGLRESSGDYVVFLDADDRLLPNALEIGTKCLVSYPECAFVSGHVRIIAEDGMVVRTPEEICIKQEHYKTLLQYNYIWTPAAVMFRRTAVESVGGFSASRFGTEDWDIYLRIARVFPVYCHDQVIAEYRVHDRQLTRDSGYMLKESFACLREQRGFIKGNKSYEDAFRSGILEIQKYFGEPLVKEIQSSFRASEWKPVLKGLLLLLRYYPRRLFRREHYQ